MNLRRSAIICFFIALLCLGGLVWSAWAANYYVDYDAAAGGDGSLATGSVTRA